MKKVGLVLTREKALQIAVQARQALTVIYGSRLREVYLFGSCARGRPRGDADIDIAVILDHVSSLFAEHEKTSQLGSELSLRENCLVSFVFANESDFRNGKYFLHRNIQKEGVPV